MTILRNVFLCVLLVGLAAVLLGQNPDNSSLRDPVTMLGKRIESGDARFEPDADRWTYLRSLLKSLDINIDSQMLVFSKTSFQLAHISPQTPRAIYFNDSVAVGAVQDGNVFELMSLDPTQGFVFYTIDTHLAGKPRFERRFTECLNCHGPAGGLVVSSVYPARDGTPFVTGTFFEGIDHRTPLENRWGGWYVSGTHGAVHHLGNAVAPNPDRPFDLEEEGTQNLTNLDSKFDATRYPVTSSDIVALMTLEHQSRMTNLIVSANQQFRRAMSTGMMEKSKASLDRVLDQLVEYMLFVDETPLRDPIKGVSTFTQTFPQRGPDDAQGRSLRDFDLQTRLFKYPLSYMIYSPIFDAMPAVARERVYARLAAVLTGDGKNPKFAHLSAADRAAIMEILEDTKPEVLPLPAEREVDGVASLRPLR